MKRLAKYLDDFARSFHRRSQRDSARRYVQGLLSDAKRKNMEGMLRRLADPGDYQTLQHFITHSTWDAKSVWKRLRSLQPERRGYLLIDDTSISKQGKHSVGVARQYCGALGKIANCQVVVSCSLRTKHAVWPLAMELHLTEQWCTDPERRRQARVPDGLVHETKTARAIRLLDEARREGVGVDCVLADSGYGDGVEFRDAIAAAKLCYAVGVSKNLKVFTAPPRLRVARGPDSRRQLAAGSPRPRTIEDVADAVPGSSWKRISWRKGVKGDLAAEFMISRVTPAHLWQRGRRNDEIWLICERTSGKDSVRKFFFSNLPADTPARELVRITHERWAVEMQYRDLKQELALDHFEGRSFPGFNRHLVLTALAYSFLQLERRRSRQHPIPSLPEIRSCITEVVTMMLFAARERFAAGVLSFIRDPPRL